MWWLLLCSAEEGFAWTEWIEEHGFCNIAANLPIAVQGSDCKLHYSDDNAKQLACSAKCYMYRWPHLAAISNNQLNLMDHSNHSQACVLPASLNCGAALVLEALVIAISNNQLDLMDHSQACVLPATFNCGATLVLEALVIAIIAISNNQLNLVDPNIRE